MFNEPYIPTCNKCHYAYCWNMKDKPCKIEQLAYKEHCDNFKHATCSTCRYFEEDGLFSPFGRCMIKKDGVKYTRHCECWSYNIKLIEKDTEK